MQWRDTREADLDRCLSLEPRQLGDEIVGRERAVSLWKQLLRTRSFVSVVLEAPPARSSKDTVGFGASVFVKAEFAARELRDPQPGLNSRILASIRPDGGLEGSVILPEAEMCIPGRPVDVVILAGTLKFDRPLSEKEVQDARMLLPVSFMETHVGYCHHHVLLETTSEDQRNFHEASGVWRTVKSYPELDRALMLLSREAAFAAPGTVAAPLFQYRPPVLDLRDTEKHLLAEALHGETDGELAARMHLSMSTIKKRWATLYEKVEERLPELLPDHRMESELRGPQKRHRILAYMRSHPEELRPFRWRSLH